MLRGIDPLLTPELLMTLGQWDTATKSPLWTPIIRR